MKKFFLNCTIFFGLIFVLDLMTGTYLKKLYFSQKQGEFQKTKFAITEANSDLIVFGSSRANHHYEPNTLTEGLELESYNMGQDGQSIFYHYALFTSILKRNKPKIVILDINANEFRMANKAYERLSSILPYYHHSTEIDEIIELRSEFERIKMFSRIYPYNSLISTLILNKLKHKDPKQEYKGFAPLSGGNKELLNKQLKDIDKIINPTYEIDSLKLNYFIKFIDAAIQNNVKLVVLTSPYLTTKKINDLSVLMTDSVCKAKRVEYHDLSYDPELSSNVKNFMDYGHLNETGAKKYSSKINHWLTDTSVSYQKN